MSAALAKREVGLLPAEPLEKIKDVQDAFERLGGAVNLVTPVATVDSIMPLHKISLRAVVIDATVDGKGNGSEVYKGKFCADNERALGKVALEKIMAAAGVQILGTRRMDDRSAPLYCEFEVTLCTRDFDGTYRQVSKTKAVDLRDGSPEAKTILAFNSGAVLLGEARKHILSNCETKAQLRALRTLLSIKQKYTLKELERPFVVPKLVPALDQSDPDQKRALIAIAAGGERALFGVQSAEANAAARLLVEAPSVPVALPAASNPPPPVGATPVSEETPDDDEPDDLSDFQAINIPASETPQVCDCPHGCQTEVRIEAAKVTKELYDAVRCAACFPGKRFNVDMHKDVKDLRLPKAPTLTVDTIARGLEQMRALEAK